MSYILKCLGKDRVSVSLSMPNLRLRTECQSISSKIVSLSRDHQWYQEYSFSRLFIPWNIRSHDGTFVLGTIRSLKL